MTTMLTPTMLTLTGTDKQIEWAMTLRPQVLAGVEAALTKAKAPAATAAAIVAEIATHNEAAWWIDHRTHAGWELAVATEAFRAAKAARG